MILVWIPGWIELSIIVLFILLLFGTKHMKTYARKAGKGVKEFNQIKDELKDIIK